MENMDKEISAYDDIIYLPHPEPRKHPRMPIENRAAQFAPFAALTGFGDQIEETEKASENERSR